MNDILCDLAFNIIKEDDDDRRFEMFSANFVSELEDTPVVVTSRNYDMGVDGKSISNSQRRIFVIASIQRINNNKYIEDIYKAINRKFGKPKKIYIASNKSLTEKKFEDIFTKVIEFPEFPKDCDLENLGADQIESYFKSGIGLSAFMNFYEADYDLMKIHLQKPNIPSERSLNLALSCMSSKDFITVKEQLTERMIIQILDNSSNLSIEDINHKVKEEYVIECISKDLCQHICEKMEQKNIVKRTEGYKWNLTDTGRGILNTIKKEEYNCHRHGKNIVRNMLFDQLDQKLDTSGWDRIWKTIEKGMIDLFIRKGKETLYNIRALLENKYESITSASIEGWRDFRSIIQEASETQSGPLKDEVLQGLLGIFSPYNKDIIDWFEMLACNYVAIYTLGLDYSIGSVISEVLSGVIISYDTDIILSYLCEHEKGHLSSEKVKKVIEKRGDKIYITHAAVEETARHAARAIIDRKHAISPKDPPLPYYRIENELDTVFGKDFEYQRASKKKNHGDWPQYIQMYSGRPKFQDEKLICPDIENMLGVLIKLGFNVLPDLEKETKSKANNIQIEYAKDKKPTDEEYKKIRIDAEILISLSEELKKYQEQGKTHLFFITSAHRFEDLMEYYKSSGETHVPIIMSLSGLMWIFSMIPETPLSPKELGSFIMEGRMNQAYRGIERILFRVMDQISTASLPQARRGVIIQDLTNKIVSISKEMGCDPEILRKKAQTDPFLFGKIAAGVIDSQIYIDPTKAKDINKIFDDLKKNLYSNKE